MHTIQLTADSTVEPLPTTDLKLHLRVTSTDEDSLIDSLEKASRKWWEGFTRRSLVDQDWKLKLKEFPARRSHIELPRAPLSSTVVTVTYFPSSGSTQTMSGSSFNVDRVDSETEYGRIVLKTTENWPDEDLRQGDAVEIDFTAGYGTNSSDVPETHKHGIRLLAAHWFDNREAVQSDRPPREVPIALKSLAWSVRVPDTPGDGQ